ncbi:MAG: glutathione S-transferase family protein [Beijerinckiaceae bacterium]
MLTLYGHPGWGSTIIEAQLDWYGVPFRYEDAGDLFKDAHARQKLLTLNGVAQVPTLVLGDGAVMTESAAITLYLADLSHSDSLVPAPQAPERAAFLRWLIFIVANIYPTFTFADDPARFVAGEEAGQHFAAQVGAYRQRLWRIVEGQAQQPWFLGERLSAIDIYVAVMSHWQPRHEWFELNAPKLNAIAAAVARQPRLKPALLRNFPHSPHLS